MQEKWFNPKKSTIKKHSLVLHYDYKPVIYGSRKKINLFIEEQLKESDRKKYVMRKTNGKYTLNKKIKYYKKESD